MNLGFTEMLFIFLLALIIFGPKKLPEIGRQIGKALAEFKRASNDFKSQIETEMRQLEIDEALRKEKDSIVRALEAPSGTVNTIPPTAPIENAAEAKKLAPGTESAGPLVNDPYAYPNFYPPEPSPAPAETPRSEAVKRTDA